MREIVLDTETTGLDPLRGDRLVEIGCVEIFNRMPTGQTFHVYINPERDMPAEAFAVHGLSAEFLSTKPLFHEVVDAFLEFIGDAPLVIHNASFDISFINAELDRIKRAAIPRERLVDTLLLARRKHPGVSNRLDDLCSRYAIDNSHRTKHGALLDPELLAEVYVDLVGRGSRSCCWRRIPRTFGSMPRAMRRGGSGLCRSRRGFQTPSATPIGLSSQPSATRRSGTSFCPLQLPSIRLARPIGWAR